MRNQKLTEYRLYDPISQRIIISRDVFEGDKNWDWDKKCEEEIVCSLEWGDEEEADVLMNMKKKMNQILMLMEMQMMRLIPLIL